MQLAVNGTRPWFDVEIVDQLFAVDVPTLMSVGGLDPVTPALIDFVERT